MKVIFPSTIWLLFLTAVPIFGQNNGNGNGNGGDGNGNGDGRMHRRRRHMAQYFPGCINLELTTDENGDVNQTYAEAFADCMEPLADERCLNETSGVSLVDMGMCLEDEIADLRENGMGGNGNRTGNGGNTGDDNGNGGNGNGNGRPQGSMGNGPPEGGMGNGPPEGGMGNGRPEGGGNGNGNGGAGGGMGNGPPEGGMGNGRPEGGMGNGRPEGGGNGNGNGGAGGGRSLQGNGSGNGNGGMGNGNGNSNSGMGMGDGNGGIAMGNGGPPFENGGPPYGNGFRPFGSDPQAEFLKSLMGTCTKDYLVCARSNLAEDLNKLPSCLRESMESLAQCVIENAEECYESCQELFTASVNGTEMSDGEQPGMGLQVPPIPRGLLKKNNLKNCGGIRNAIHRPMCRRMSCCSPCFEALEAHMDCFFDNMVDYLPERCSQTCPAILAETTEDEDAEEDMEGENDEGQENEEEEEDVDGEDMEEENTKAFQNENDRMRRFLQTKDEYEAYVYEQCIELAPGINENHRSEEELAARGAEFFNCIMSSFAEVMELKANGTISATAESASGSLRFGVSFSVLFLGMALFFRVWS